MWRGAPGRPATPGGFASTGANLIDELDGSGALA
jgi:hypothetical protein